MYVALKRSGLCLNEIKKNHVFPKRKKGRNKNQIFRKKFDLKINSVTKNEGDLKENYRIGK